MARARYNDESLLNPRCVEYYKVESIILFFEIKTNNLLIGGPG